MIVYSAVRQDFNGRSVYKKTHLKYIIHSITQSRMSSEGRCIARKTKKGRKKEEHIHVP